MCAAVKEDAVRRRTEDACAERLPRFERPKRVAFFAVPRTAIGKVQRFVLRDLARR